MTEKFKKKCLLPVTPLCSNGKIEVGTKFCFFPPSFSSLSEGMCLLQWKLIEEIPLVLQLVRYMDPSGKARFLSLWEIRKNCSSQKKESVILEVNIRCFVISGPGGYMRTRGKWDAEKWGNLGSAKERSFAMVLFSRE